MPVPAVLLVAAFFLVGLVIIAQPVNPARLERFALSNGIDLTKTGREQLGAYLRRRRQWRTAGVLVAAAIGLFFSVPDNRVAFGYVPLAVGWFVGAAAVEATGRSGTQRIALPYWWRSLPYPAAGIAALWTAAAVYMHSDGVDLGPLVGWGTGAIVAALVIGRAVGVVIGRPLVDMDAGYQEALAVNAARGLTLGGGILALVCAAQVWHQAVPGPYEDPEHQFPTVAALLVGILLLAIAVRWERQADAAPRRAWHWLIYAAVAVLPFAWAIPMRVAQSPPISIEQANPTAQLRLAGGGRMKDARADLGLTAEHFEVAEFADHQELMGRVDVPPAPDGSAYELFAYDRSRNRPVANIYDDSGAGWYGGWTLVLPVRYPWLSPVMNSRNEEGFRIDPSAVSPRNGGPFWFHGIVDVHSGLSLDEVELVLMLTRERDSYVYWAVRLPVTRKAFD